MWVILPCRSARRGFALPIVLVMTGVSFLMLGGLLMWTMTSSRLASRNTDLQTALATAEAATEKVFSRLSTDYHDSGQDVVHGSLATYVTLIPDECPEWSDFLFMDPYEVSDRVYVNERQPWSYSYLQGKYSSFQGFNAVYDIVSNVRLNTGSGVTAAVWQQVQIAALPVASFSYFYNVDLELHPWHDWNVTGQVHCNANCYFKPSAVLTFEEGVTAVGRITHDDHPLDPESRSFGSVVYEAGSQTNAMVLSLFSSTNEAAVAHEIIEPPPTGENALSLIGRQRYYNKADLIVTVDGPNLTDIHVFNAVARGLQPVRWSIWTNFLSPISASFYDHREDRSVIGTVLNVSALNTNVVELRNDLGADFQTDGFVIYVVDYRTNASPSTPLAAVRIEKAASLPGPFALATPNPLYTVGDFNLNGEPASLACDAITVLSRNWNDTNSAGNVSTRKARDTTVNAAVITGIVPTGIYDGEQRSSGWLANVFRLLEDWSDNEYPPEWDLTFKGSIAVLFASQQATEPWYSGWNGYYNAPNRDLDYDPAFLTQAGLPPACPTVSAVIRCRYETLPPGSLPP